MTYTKQILKSVDWIQLADNRHYLLAGYSEYINVPSRSIKTDFLDRLLKKKNSAKVC
jgi:hypothetical protein